MISNEELPFRAAFGIFWLINMVVRIYFQSKVIGIDVATKTHEQRSRMFFRLFALSYLLMLFYIFSSWFDFAHFFLSTEVRWWCGGGVLIAYILLFSCTHIALGRNWSGLLEIHQDHTLIISGPYEYIRHPMYAAFILSGIGFLFLSANWFVGGLYLTIAIAMYLDRVGPEEQMMSIHFGVSYSEYMKRTGRLFPKVRK